VAQYAHEKGTYRIIGASALIMSFVLAIISSVVVWILRVQIGVWLDSPRVAAGLVWALPGVFFFTINRILLAVLNGLSRMKTYAVFSALRYVLILGTVLVLAAFRVPGEVLPAVFSIAEIILFICQVVSLRSDFSVPTLSDLRVWIRIHLNFSLRGYGSAILGGLGSRFNVLILGYFASDQTVGIYSLAAAAMDAIAQLPIILRTVFSPILVRYIDTRKFVELHALFKKVMAYTYLGMLVIGAGAVLAFPFGLKLVSNQDKYIQGWPIFAILMLGIVIYSGYIPVSNILLLGGRPGMQSWLIFCMTILVITLNLLLVPTLGGIGTALATAIGYVATIPLLKYLANKTLKVQI
jgi:O-antigen/teichoic acid export membrane protein